VRAVAVAVLALVAVGCGVLLALSERESTGSGTLRTAQPVRRDAAAEATLRTRVARVARGCREASRSTTASPDDSVIDAVAAIACDARAISATTLTVFQFADAATAKRSLLDHVQDTSLRGPCTGGDGLLAWSDRGGRTRGTILCLIAPSSRLVWTDNARKTLSIATSDSQSTAALLGWWQASYRPPTAASRAEGERLARSVRKLEAGADCSESPAASPLSVATITCTLQGSAYERVRGLRLERVGSRALLRRRIDAVGASLSLSGGTCTATSPLGRGSWHDGDHVRGTLFCAPQGNGELYSWTRDDARLYVTMRYAGGDERGAFEVWANHLATLGA
jgi:hypothetical protein